MRKLHVKFPRLGNFINIDFQLCKDIITGIDNHTVQQWVQIVSQRTFLFINIFSCEFQVETFHLFLWEYFIKILWLCSCLKTWITPSEIFIFKRKYTSWRHIINTDLCRLGGTYTICIMVEFQKSGWSTGLNVRDYVKICLKEHQSTYLNWTKLLQKGGVIVQANWSEHNVICPKYYKISNEYCSSYLLADWDVRAALKNLQFF